MNLFRIQPARFRAFDRNASRPAVRALSVALLFTGALLTACEDKPSAPLAPSASAVTSAPPPMSADAKTFVIDKGSSKVEFMMDAPIEKIHGLANGSSVGELHLDLKDLNKSSGTMSVDISGLEIKQTVVTDAGPGEEKKDETQNKHARTWLQISDDAPAEDRAANSIVKFGLTSITDASPADVTKMTGAERKVTLKATGDFLLHGHKAQKTAELEATFKFDGDKPVSVSVKTTKPFPVNLDEHDVRPREKFGQLAKSTLDILSPKVAKDAMVSLDFTAKSSDAPAK